MSELPDPETFGDYSRWPGRQVHGPGGRIGDVREIYLDDATDRPEWVPVCSMDVGDNDGTSSDNCTVSDGKFSLGALGTQDEPAYFDLRYWLN